MTLSCKCNTERVVQPANHFASGIIGAEWFGVVGWTRRFIRGCLLSRGPGHLQFPFREEGDARMCTMFRLQGLSTAGVMQCNSTEPAFCGSGLAPTYGFPLVSVQPRQWFRISGMISSTFDAVDNPLGAGDPVATAGKAGRVMIVDDDPIIVRLMEKYLNEAGYEDLVTTVDSRQAMALIRREKPDIVLLDIMMPHVTGLQILDEIRLDAEFAHLPVLIVTASNSETMKIEALELGATDFLPKPLKAVDLVPRVRNALVLKAHHDQIAAYSKRLEKEVAERTAALAQARQEVIHVLACAAEYRDHETGNHVVRVGRFAGVIARELGFSDERVELIEQAAILHDAGKIGIADSILLKPDKLTEQEHALMQRHCEFGERILKAEASEECSQLSSLRKPQFARSPILETAAVIALTHHERWDGKGYPRGLAGENIPIEGRITAVADVFDALSSRRCYKEPLPLDQCIAGMLEERGKHFDPRILDAFLKRIDEAARIVVLLSD